MSFRDDVRGLRGESLELRKVLEGVNQGADPTGTSYYVDAYDGQDGNDGKSWTRPFLTMDAAFDAITSGDTIFFRGKVLEQLQTPVQVHDVTVVGASNRPRHADASPADPTGKSHGASWQPPTSPTAETPLVEVRQQGWTFVNILFDAPADAAAVQLTSDAGSGDAERDASHASFYGCKFVGGQSGIETSGGQAHVLVSDCEFNALTNGIECLDTGVRVPQFWHITRSKFQGNTNGIRSSFEKSVIDYNHFDPDHTVKIDAQYNSGQGGNNLVGPGNFLGGTYEHAGYQDATGDEWAGNFNAAGITTANPAA